MPRRKKETHSTEYDNPPPPHPIKAHLYRTLTMHKVKCSIIVVALWNPKHYRYCHPPLRRVTPRPHPRHSTPAASTASNKLGSDNIGVNYFPFNWFIGGVIELRVTVGTGVVRGEATRFSDSQMVNLLRWLTVWVSGVVQN